MSNSVQERLKLKRITLDTWSTREKLSLATSVQRSGDQNWSCVSRNIKAFSEPNRPQDWFSQKNCAQQYAGLLENVETPKRKKRSAGSTDRTEVETPGESIVRKLTDERIYELKKIMSDVQAEYLKILEECNAIANGEVDDKIPQHLQELENEKERKQQEKDAHIRWLREREERRLELERAWKPGLLLASLRRESSLSEPSSDADSPLSEPLAVDVPDELPTKPTPTPTSPLLTSLLKSPAGSTTTSGASALLPPPNAPPTPGASSILHSAITSPLRGVSPTIASLLNSSPVSLPAPHGMPPGSVSPNLKSLVSSALAAFDDQKPLLPSPSQGAPTLSMLLELPPSMPGKPLPVLQVQPPAPPPYAEHLGPPPPYSLATEYLQKQRAEQAAQAAQAAQVAQAQLAIRNVEKELMLPSIPVVQVSSLPFKSGLKTDIDLADIEEVIAVDTSRSQFSASDHDYMEPEVKQELPQEETSVEDTKPEKKELDVFEFGEEEENDAKMSYLKSNAKRLAKKEADKLTSPSKTKPQDEEGNQELEEDSSVVGVEQVAEDVEEPNRVESTVVHVEEVVEQETGMPESEPKEEVETLEEDALSQDEVGEVYQEPEGPSEVLQDSDTAKDGGTEGSADESQIKDEGDDLDSGEVTLPDDNTSMGGPDATLNEDDKSNEATSISESAMSAAAAAVKRRRGTDSVPNSPVSFTEEEKEYRSWKKSVQMVQSRIEGHKSASLFLKPITDDQAPDYSSIVLRPMDLSSIKRNVESGVLRTTAEYQRDVMLMFFNARMYNKTNDVIYQQAVSMQKDSLDHIQVLMELRGDTLPSRRETRTHDKMLNTRQSRSSAKSTPELKRKRNSTSADGARKKIQLEEA